MKSLDQFAAAKLAEREERGLLRTLKRDTRIDGLWIERAGKRLLSFACNDYLNLSCDPRVKAAAADAAMRYGAGAGASRLITGNHPLLVALEEKLAAFKGTEAACVFGSGYLANSGITPCLVKAGDMVLIDELAHSCLWIGAKLSGAEIIPVRHNDTDHLRALLQTKRGAFKRALVLADTIYSMDGDLAPLDRIAALCEEFDAWLMTDDAHGLGVVSGGRGGAHAFAGVKPPLQMGTLSKAAGSYGGYLCASRDVIEWIKNSARTFVYSTGLPPPSAGAALEALAIIESEPDRVARPLANARRFTAALALPSAESAVVPLVLGAPSRALAAQEMLEARGFLVVAIRPPTVPQDTARLRFAFTAAHSDDDIDRLAASVAEVTASL